MNFLPRIQYGFTFEVVAKVVSQLGSNARFLTHLVRTGQFNAIGASVRHKIWTDTVSFGLRRDLTIPFQAPEATIPIAIRRATQRDLDMIADLNEPGVSPDELTERVDRLCKFNTALMETSYVGVTEDDIPCFFQMIVYPAQNSIRQEVWDKVFPEIEPDQVLLEGVYVPAIFRGKRIMPMAMAGLSDIACANGAKEAITFVDSSNVASLKGCVRAGYGPYCHRISRWRLFHERVDFVPIPIHTPISGVTELTGDTTQSVD